ncbi:1-deoxy-D-xylulose-5-phosphate reductoisomerase [Dyadobacter fanqingshengii]|uniref:1-deoxy-D-xylulose 5-phosphate reductoisomerase n=1 Tax=Dyadobacter fanqingshengii TaxID=2906443 RepID=A0A9X1PHN2_9BACT|nr:1-deoxy-D-xylulose-5-phosphate reductoisomerase [Dyadobacter fanqingshengii]MCF0043497.1 1-deoxy-D-xylulose-5-phosphate reductoisomerase [Dyadobacter fanqingshengii]USJ34884.1 1-deoxy-D-xylulose-5-phosphate reductoisomerase [Dyadobacter fanqingshengii]
MKKNIAILGSTGSIGTQALEVMGANPEIFSVSVLTAQENADLLIEQAAKFLPKAVVIGNEKHFDKVKSALSTFNIHVYSGIEALVSVVESDDIDTVLTAMVGYAGLLPTIHAIKAGKDIALANKETLVVAGELITGLARQYGVNIYPVDSEHSAIFQCLVGEEGNRIEKIILTASGGPFRGKDRAYLAHVTREQALKHPNWSMGAKITIDSATLMNKGLEVIEAKWLFDLEASQIDVIVHPQSIVHSLVQFEDGSIKAQMGLPDMKLPIQYALRYPARLKSAFPRFNFTDYPSLTFEKPDLDTFRNLAIAYEVLEKGGNAACIVNAANEIAVEAFLQGKIGFLDISDLIVESLAKISYISTPTYSDYVQTNEATRRFASELIQVKV